MPVNPPHATIPQVWRCLLRLVQRHVKGADKAALPTGTERDEKQIVAMMFCPTFHWAQRSGCLHALEGHLKQDDGHQSHNDLSYPALFRFEGPLQAPSDLCACPATDARGRSLHAQLR